MSTEPVVRDRGEIRTILESVKSGDELTIEAEGEINGEETTWRDNREVDFVSHNGDIQFGDPGKPHSRVVDPDSLTVYELGNSPDQPLVNGLEITRVWDWRDTGTDEIQQPDMESMSPSDWKEYLTRHQDRCLVVNAEDGVHAFQYEDIEGRVTFFAQGSLGYDEDGTQAALDQIAGTSDGLRVQTIEETYEGDS
ncbi:hypothetical protein Htur_5078 (plasmid) [Haloterrigena turkmenica DSM 5511]|uniref:Uncharacterized protein n=1 Tax=Haloterrigena turkmenica (strain ATCC 51198 / DSM 5511 / JCM 9101 / NCIMB 13204 / VKM B-1734 / 4k) TaxID=543526 RepID=D2S3L8_HALTV|nr:hypothetical protein [Haloterrigena turkmenica]ADB63965.1 hypothetical protein Htur_5078 [Haloterrigena turkmenica DSM 5511]